MKRGRVTGLEPANDGTTTHCLNQLGHTRQTIFNTTLSFFIVLSLVFWLKIFYIIE